MDRRCRTLGHGLGLPDSHDAGTDLFHRHSRMAYQHCEFCCSCSLIYNDKYFFLKLFQVLIYFWSLFAKYLLGVSCSNQNLNSLDWLLSRGTTCAPNDLFVLLFDDERLVAPYETNELDERQENGHFCMYRPSRSFYFSTRIQRMSPIARSHLHDDRHCGKRRCLRLYLGDFR